MPTWPGVPVYPLVPAGNQQMAIYVQAQLRRVGVEMVVQMQEIGPKRDKLEMGEFEGVFYGDGVLFNRYGLTGPNFLRTNGLGYQSKRQGGRTGGPNRRQCGRWTMKTPSS